MSIVRTASLSWPIPIHYRTLTIDHTKCGTADSGDFTVYVTLTENFIKSQSNGGYVKYTSGNDIVFTSDSAGTSLLTWEIDYYDPVGGNLYAWVRFPLITHSTDTVFYMNVGNATYSTFQGGALGAAWNSRWQAVYHLANGTTLNINDSTATGNNLTNNTPNVAAVAGKLDGAGGFGTLYGGSYLSMNTPTLPSGSAARSICFWFRMTGGTGSIEALMGYGSTSFGAAGASFSIRYSLTYLAVFCGSSTQSRFTFAGDANWHHLVVTFPAGDDLTNTIMYIDGAALTSIFLINGTINTVDTVLNLGLDSTASFANYDGILDEVEIANVVLSPSYITTMYNNQNNFSTFITLGGWHT